MNNITETKRVVHHGFIRDWLIEPVIIIETEEKLTELFAKRCNGESTACNLKKTIDLKTRNILLIPCSGSHGDVFFTVIEPACENSRITVPVYSFTNPSQMCCTPHRSGESLVLSFPKTVEPNVEIITTCKDLDVEKEPEFEGLSRREDLRKYEVAYDEVKRMPWYDKRMHINSKTIKHDSYVSIISSSVSVEEAKNQEWFKSLNAIEQNGAVNYLKAEQKCEESWKKANAAFEEMKKRLRVNFLAEV